MPPGEFKKRAVLAIFPLELLFRIDVMTDAHIPRAHESLIHPNFVFIIYFFSVAVGRGRGEDGRPRRRVAGCMLYRDETRNESCLELGICVVE